MISWMPAFSMGFSCMDQTTRKINPISFYELTHRLLHTVSRVHVQNNPVYELSSKIHKEEKKRRQQENRKENKLERKKER